ncbi:hypothetical protein NSQ26_00775 [Bacillus sp. FSL W7-1360]
MHSAPQQTPPVNGEHAPVMTVKDWIITSLLMMIPIANIILLFVWAFGDNVNPNKANLFKATLLLYAIMIGIGIILTITFFIIGITLSVGLS